MPVVLIVIGDKSHTDLHGTLSLTPIMFTLTLFDRSACNNTRFWRPIGHIPNLSHAKGLADRQLTNDKIQDEHICISCILQSPCNISNGGGFDLVVLGHNVCVKVRIHYFIRDTEGINKWLSQYPQLQQAPRELPESSQRTPRELPESSHLQALVKYVS
jgi:hypothetical protein